MSERVICPHCGSSDIESRWVEQFGEPKIKELDFEQYAEKLKERMNQKPYGINIIDNCTSYTKTVKDYLQLVLECQRCGFTKVYDLDGKEK